MYHPSLNMHTHVCIDKLRRFREVLRKEKGTVKRIRKQECCRNPKAMDQMRPVKYKMYGLTCFISMSSKFYSKLSKTKTKNKTKNR